MTYNNTSSGSNNTVGGKTQTIQKERPPPLDRCPVTRQIKISSSDGDGGYDDWVLETYDEHGNAKSVGGDEYYVAYFPRRHEHGGSVYKHLHPAGVASNFEYLQDGKYGFRFHEPPPVPPSKLVRGSMGGGTGGKDGGVLVVWLHYTCGIGRIPPPTKEGWKTGGAILSETLGSTVTAEGLQVRPRIRPFRKPNDDSSINFSAYDQVVYVGDSIMGQFSWYPASRSPRSRHLFLRLSSPLTLGTVRTNFLEPTIQKYDDQLSSPNSAILIGSGAWDLLVQIDGRQGEAFEDHIAACRALVEGLRERYPNLPILEVDDGIPTTLNKSSCYANPSCIANFRYLSVSRADYLYGAQKRLMEEELKVPVLDMYEATSLSAHHTSPDDGRHYDKEINALMSSWFYSSS